MKDTLDSICKTILIDKKFLQHIKLCAETDWTMSIEEFEDFIAILYASIRKLKYRSG